MRESSHVIINLLWLDTMTHWNDYGVCNVIKSRQGVTCICRRGGGDNRRGWVCRSLLCRVPATNYKWYYSARYFISPDQQSFCWPSTTNNKQDTNTTSTPWGSTGWTVVVRDLHTTGEVRSHQESVRILLPVYQLNCCSKRAAAIPLIQIFK